MAEQLGNESPNDDVRQAYERFERQCRSRGETIDYYLAFDFGQKVMALTDRRVMIIGAQGAASSFMYLSIARVSQTGHDRQIALYRSDEAPQVYRVGDAQVAKFVRDEIFSRVSRRRTSSGSSGPAASTSNQSQTTSASSPTTRNNAPPPTNDTGGDSGVAIADRVRFWEEQDRINRELIPRVIRQHELLTQHIGEHDNLPEVAGRAIATALAEAQEEQRQQFKSALETAQTRLAEQSDAKLQQALVNLQAVLNSAKTELGEQNAVALSQALADLQSALAAHKTEISEQTQAGLNQALTTMQQESRQSRNLLIGIAAGSAAISVALIIINIVIG